MKNVLVSTFFLFSLVMTACSQNTKDDANTAKPEPTASPAAVTEAKKLKPNECKICDLDVTKYKGELNKEEINGLLLALNDEYLAFAIYEQVNKDFKDPRPFVNIVQAEDRHSSRLKDLFTTYGLQIPANPWTGNAPKFASVAEACKAGVDAEIVNKELYDRLFASTKREDILNVYKALQRASEQNHLPAFQRCGGGGNGNGNGWGRGHGRPNS